MATLQNLRNKAGLLLAIVIFIALAAFILGDLLTSGNKLLQGNQLKIAKVNDKSVEYPEFQKRFDEIANIYKQNNQTNNLDENAYQQILNQAWEGMVQDLLMADIYDELGIEVTSEEMFDMVQGNKLHPIINQVFGNPQTGQVDKAQIIQFLKYIQENPNAPQKATWLNIEKQILKSKLMSKYTDLVGKGLYANSLQAKESNAVKNKTASLKFIQKKLSTVKDTEVSFNESDLKKYYEEHSKEFEQKASRTISYVSFDIVPSAQDDQDALKWISEIKGDFMTATDNVQFVNANSDNRFEDTYVKETSLPAQLALWVTNATINDVTGPYKEGNVYKLAKLNATKMLPDSVKASHILIRVQSAADAQKASNTIDSLKRVIESERTTFELAAISNSQDGSAKDGGNLGWFSHGMMVPEFENASFRAEKGDLVKVQTQFGFHLIKVTDQSKKSLNYQLATVEREVIASTQTYQDIYTQASKFASNASDLEGFKKQAAQLQLTPQSATIGENDRQVPGIGDARSLVRSAWVNTKVGGLVQGNDKAPVFELDKKFIVAALVGEKEEGLQSFASAKPAIELAVINQKKKELLMNQFTKAMGSSIEQTASQLGLSTETASGFNFNYGSVNAIGYEPVINGAAAGLTPNKQSKPIEGKNGVYIIELTSVTGEADGNLEAEKKALYQSSSYKANYQAYQTLKDKAEIKDMRSKFY
jgi:peptidyl-prolyl cis-trans isomerase D